MIKKQGSKYKVKDSTGKKTLGTHSSKQAALNQLAAIEISKAGKSSKESKPTILPKTTILSIKPAGTKAAKSMECC